MKNLDSLTLKFFYEENKDFLTNGTIQKIQMPSRKEIILYIRNSGENKKLYININPKFPHICFIKDKEDFSLKIPKTPPMFCMQLRKYLEGAKIINAVLIEYERILEFHFSITDEFGILNNHVLSIELMGKYSNVILYNKKTNIITGSAHNVSSDKSSIREIYGGIKYIYPPKQNKKDILKTPYGVFLNSKENISDEFYYFSKPFEKFIKEKSSNDDELFYNLQNAVNKKDLLKEFWNIEGDFNAIIENYYSKIVKDDSILNKQNKLLKIINSKLKKINSTLNEPFDNEKFEKYKKSGDLIFQYIYLIDNSMDEITLEDIKIPLDKSKTPAQNAQRYYKLYNKAKSAKLIKEKRILEAKKEKEYSDEILFSIKNASNIKELDEIEEEIDEYILLNKKEKKNKPEIKSINYKGFEILIGKNNKQNDFIIKKLSTPEDIWFHAQNSPSSHILVKTQNGRLKITDDVILYAANLVKTNSPLKDAKKAGVIYTKRKYLKRPPDTPLGYVTYREEKEVIV